MSVVQFKQPVSKKMKSDGFAMNDRSILKADWYKNINARLIYLELSLRVSHSTHQTTFNGHEITLTRGQFVTKLDNLAKVIDGNKGQADYALKVLEKSGVITRRTIGRLNKKCTIITLDLDEKESTPVSTASQHAEPQKQRAITATVNSLSTPDSTLNQEVSKSIKDIYVKNDKSFLVRDIVKTYNEAFPELASVAKITPTRKSKVLKIIGDKFTLPDGTIGTFKTVEDWEGFFDYVRGSDFLMGRSSDWQMTFDFMVNGSNFIKIIEGNYDNK
jgi:hypothetical protein